MAWDPDQYNKFKAQRSQPFLDLMALVKGDGFSHAVDLGCGTGEMTQKMHIEKMCQNTLGIDSSPEMLSESKKYESTGLHFETANIDQFVPKQKCDLVYSNAALQWLPNHETLMPKIFDWVKPGGQLAIQMPYNFEHPSHQIAARVASEKFGLKGIQHIDARPVEYYSELIFRQGFSEQSCSLKIYGHPMRSVLDVVEWVKGTCLTTYQRHLSADDFKKFVEIYSSELINALKDQMKDGVYYYAFKRILLWGQRQ